MTYRENCDIGDISYRYFSRRENTKGVFFARWEIGWSGVQFEQEKTRRLLSEFLYTNCLLTG